MKVSRSFGARAARLCSMGLIAGGMVALPALPAQADTFTPNNQPTVAVQADAVDFVWSAGSAFDAKTIVVAIGDGDTLDDISDVVICLYKTGGDSTCAAPDPQTNMEVTWTNTDVADTQADGFVNTVSSPVNVNWAITGELSAVYNPAAFSTELLLSVAPSVVATEGDWNIKATITDRAATPSTNTHDPGNTVWTPNMPYFSGQTQRPGVAWGQITTLETTGIGTAYSQNQSSGSDVVTNATSTLNFEAGNFSGGAGSDMTNLEGVLIDADPAAGQYTLACGMGDTYNDATSKALILTSASGMGATEATGGTVEAGVTPSNTSCRLTSGGSDLRREVTGTVTVSFTQSP
ncbi:MAG: hypothetical protein Q8P61_05090 [Candidatus Nanopelagicales bacterium]|nr:hypothetical protein [Candidatus Nanopelagicales bacterium]